MDYYVTGKRMLDIDSIADAKASFQKGLAHRDIRCAYGLLAVAATAGEDLHSPMAQLRKAIPKLEAAAQTGDGDACFILARCYETGSVYPRDMAKAMELYQRSADSGNADAMFNLGCIYMTVGPGGQRLAKDYFERAAVKNCADAQFALGRYYEEAGDLECANNWYRRAAQNGSPAMKEKLFSMEGNACR